MWSIEFILTVLLGLGFFVYYLREYFQGGQFNKPTIRLTGKVVIVTGANTGIGKETALDLARRGAVVYMACRDPSTGDAARKEIIERTGNHDVFNWTLDLASLDSVRDFAKRQYFEGTQYENIGIYIPRRVVVITECSSGIGKETALELAKRGAFVYMACKDVKKCEEARDEIIRLTSNRGIFCRELDLASIKSIRSFAKRFLQEERKLHILINNATVLSKIYTKTEDGFEMHMGVNHLGHFLLTNLLLGALKAAAPSRVIILANASYKWTSIDQSDLMSECRSYSWMRSFAQSQLANMLFTRQLAILLSSTSVRVNAVHPGFVWTPSLRNMLGIWQWPLSFFMKSVRSGAQTTIAAALEPNFRPITGRYFSDCALANEASCAKDDETAKWLWMTSERMTGLEKMSFENEQTRC